MNGVKLKLRRSPELQISINTSVSVRGFGGPVHTAATMGLFWNIGNIGVRVRIEGGEAILLSASCEFWGLDSRDRERVDPDALLLPSKPCAGLPLSEGSLCSSGSRNSLIKRPTTVKLTIKCVWWNKVFHNLITKKYSERVQKYFFYGETLYLRTLHEFRIVFFFENTRNKTLILTMMVFFRRKSRKTP